MTDDPNPPAAMAGEPDPLISVRKLTRIYKRPRTGFRTPRAEVAAVDDVSFDIAKGERYGIVGESGSGKSTLIRLISGLDQPTSGSIVFEGHDITTTSERQRRHILRRLQFVFQDPMGSLNPRMRVSDIIAEPLVALGEPSNDDRVIELLESVGLSGQARHRFPHQFSGGQRQRISIARALAPRPTVLVADEPVSALDVSVRAQILNLLMDIAEEFGLTLIFVSHDLSVVRNLCDSIAVLHQGKIVESGSTDDVYSNPQHDYTRRLLAAVPTIGGALAGIDAATLARGAGFETGADQRV